MKTCSLPWSNCCSGRGRRILAEGKPCAWYAQAVQGVGVDHRVIGDGDQRLGVVIVWHAGAATRQQLATAPGALLQVASQVVESVLLGTAVTAPVSRTDRLADPVAFEAFTVDDERVDRATGRRRHLLCAVLAHRHAESLRPEQDPVSLHGVTRRGLRGAGSPLGHHEGRCGADANGGKPLAGRSREGVTARRGGRHGTGPPRGRGEGTGDRQAGPVE